MSFRTESFVHFAARFLVAAGFLLATLCWGAPNRVEAGDRELAILFVNMTPDAASTDASKACIAAIRNQLKAGYTIVTAKGESWIRARHPDGKAQDFMSWSTVVPTGSKELGYVDALMLVDCRPEQSLLQAWISPANGRVGTLRLQRKPSKADVAFFSKMMLVHGWLGFVP